MRISGPTLAAATTGLLLGAIGGAMGGIALYENAYGNPAELWASRAAEYGLFLCTPSNEVRCTEAVVEHIRQSADHAILMAAWGYDRLRPVYRENLQSTVAKMQKHYPAASATDNVSAQYATATRACIASNAADPAAVSECAREATDAIQARYCTNGVCSFPDRQ